MALAGVGLPCPAPTGLARPNLLHPHPTLGEQHPRSSLRAVASGSATFSNTVAWEQSVPTSGLICAAEPQGRARVFDATSRSATVREETADRPSLGGGDRRLPRKSRTSPGVGSMNPPFLPSLMS
jgi:hypothetical protein